MCSLTVDRVEFLSKELTCEEDLIVVILLLELSMLNAYLIQLVRICSSNAELSTLSL